MNWKIPYLLVALLWTKIGWTQQKDFGTWTYFNFQYKISENWSIGYSDHQLTHENASEKWMFFHDFSLNQKINRHFSHELHLRWIQFQKLNDILEDRSLFFYAVNGNWNFRNWSITARSRWQTLTFGNHWSDDYKGPYHYHRVRLALGKRLNYHWKCEVSSEFFQPLNRPNRKGIDQIRIGPAISYRYNKNWSLVIFYQIQKQMKRVNPYTYYLIGTGINLTL